MTVRTRLYGFEIGDEVSTRPDFVVKVDDPQNPGGWKYITHLDGIVTGVHRGEDSDDVSVLCNGGATHWDIAETHFLPPVDCRERMEKIPPVQLSAGELTLSELVRIIDDHLTRAFDRHLRGKHPEIEEKKDG